MSCEQLHICCDAQFHRILHTCKSRKIPAQTRKPFAHAHTARDRHLSHQPDSGYGGLKSRLPLRTDTAHLLQVISAGCNLLEQFRLKVSPSPGTLEHESCISHDKVGLLFFTIRFSNQADQLLEDKSQPARISTVFCSNTAILPAYHIHPLTLYGLKPQPFYGWGPHKG